MNELMLSIPQFDIHDTDGLSQKFDKWITRLNRIMMMNKVEQNETKISYLFVYGGDDLENLYESLVENKSDDYEEIVKTLKDYFSPKLGCEANLLNFRLLKQATGEPFSEFVSRLREAASKCEMKKDIFESEMISQIIQKCRSDRLRRKASERSSDEKDKMKLNDLITMGRNEEAIDAQCRAMSAQILEPNTSTHAEINALQSVSHNQNLSRSTNHSNQNSNWTSNKTRSELQNEHKQPKDNKCNRCGGKYPHGNTTCPAIGTVCFKCGKINHFAKQCKSKSSKSARQVNFAESQYDPNKENETKTLTTRIRNVWRIGSTKVANAVKRLIMPMVTLFFCLSNVSFTVDTGSDIDVISKKQFNKLKIKPRLDKCNLILFGFGNKTV